MQIKELGGLRNLRLGCAQRIATSRERLKPPSP